MINSLLLMLAFPLLVGLFIYLLKPALAISFGERVEGFMVAQKERAATHSGFVNDFIFVPFFSVLMTTANWTLGIKDQYARCAVRVMLDLYIGVAFILLAYVAFRIVMFMIGLAIVIGAFWILNRIFGGSEDRLSTSYQETSSDYVEDHEADENAEFVTRYSGRKGQIVSGTNWLNEENVGRVDEKGTIFEGSNWFNEQKAGRVADDGTLFKGSNWLTEEKQGRIDEDGNIYKGSNWLTEEKIGRVDDEGNIIEGTNFFNEKKVGRIDDNK